MRNIILAVLSILSLQHLSAQGENLFDDTYLHEIHFENMDTTMINGQKIYQMVLMKFDGEIVDSIGIKDKGNISNNVPNKKLPFKVKTNKYVNGKKYDGIKEFTLHNNYQDPSLMREKLTYDFCGQLGLYAPRTAFAKVYINNSYWGLYTIVEGKDELFKQQFDHRDADAIESLDFGNMCFISNTPDDYNVDISGAPNYQLENGDVSTAFPRFADMIDKANNTADDNYLAEVSSHLNLEDFFKYQAANVYLMNFDSYIGFLGNQIYMYDTLNTLWQVIPWDFNASLNLWDNGNGTQTAAAYPLFPNKIINGCIAEKMNTIPALKDYYLNAMCNLVYELGDTMAINDRIDFFKMQISSAVKEDWRKVYSTEEFNQTTEYGSFNIDFNEFEGLKTFFEDRHNLIKQALLEEGFACAPSSTNTIEKALNIQIYPNPSQGLLHLKRNQNVQRLCVYDMQGKKLREIDHPQFPIDIADLGSGMYVLSMMIEEQMATTKIFLTD